MVNASPALKINDRKQIYAINMPYAKSSPRNAFCKARMEIGL